ncbi:MAG: zinc-binding dehydrogenase, partial [Rhodospirillales bacterium]|nr:zinc-binding dehydrogenase [Rhodospirillales bacterium]
VSKVEPGDHVVMTFGSCGACPTCLEAHPSYCHNFNNFVSQRNEGSHCLSAGNEAVHGDFFSQSSFATFSIGIERSVVKVRKDAPLALLGPLGCGIQTGAGAILNEFRLTPGKTLAVFGVGSLGLSAVMAARIAGASRIIAINRHEKRLELAVQQGATDKIEAGDDPVLEELLELIPIGVDFTLDTTGAPPVMAQAIEGLAPMGTCGFVTGPWDGSPLPLTVRPLMKGRVIRGIGEGGSNPDIFIPRLIDFFMDGHFPMDRLAQEYAFTDIAQAFADSEAGETVKPILRFD